MVQILYEYFPLQMSFTKEVCIKEYNNALLAASLGVGPKII
jgi:hypothetical protein